MSSPLRSETAFPKQSPSRGVWGFMKRKVWGDVASHPISDTESETQREASPEGSDVATGSSPDLSTPKSPTEPRPHSPFQSHVSAQPEDESNEEARPDLQAGRGPAGNTASMASEPSLRHGLGKGTQGQHSAQTDRMDRLPSLAAGISGAGFEWSPSPARRPLPVVVGLDDDTNVTFSYTKPSDSSNRSTARSDKLGSSNDIFSSWNDLDDVHNEGGSDTNMHEEQDSSRSASTSHEQDQEAESVFSAMQTRAPGLTPLRLTPKTNPHKSRAASPPPPTSFPSGSVAAQGDVIPHEDEQIEEQMHASHASDLTPSPRTGAIVDELLEGVVSDNLATAEDARDSPEHEPRPHGALPVGPAPSELQWFPHDATQVEGLSDEQSGALRIPQPGKGPTQHGALPVDAMPRAAQDSPRRPWPDLPETASSPRSAASGTTSSPRSPFRAAVDYAETAIGLTGGAVAGLMAGSALVGIGAAALTGGAVLNAIDFPRSPRLAPAVSTSASDPSLASSPKASAHTQQATVARPGAEVSSTPSAEASARTSGGRPTLERSSTSVKRQADSAWPDSQSPLKRLEFDQFNQSSLSAPQATADESTGTRTAMEQVSASDTASAADDTAVSGVADSDTAMDDAAVPDPAAVGQSASYAEETGRPAAQGSDEDHKEQARPAYQQKPSEDVRDNYAGHSSADSDGSDSLQQIQPAAAEAAACQVSAATSKEPQLDSSLGTEAAAETDIRPEVSQGMSTVPEEPSLSSSLAHQAAEPVESHSSSSPQADSAAPPKEAAAPADQGSTSIQQATSIARPDQAYGREGRSDREAAAGSRAEHATRDFGSSRQEAVPDAPTLPQLQSSVGQSAADNTQVTAGSKSHQQTPGRGSVPQQPALESALGQEAAAGDSSVDIDLRKQAAESEAVAEPVMHYGVGQEAASREEGEEARLRHSSDSSRRPSYVSDHQAGPTFPEEHQVRNTAPGSNQGYFAEPLSSHDHHHTQHEEQAPTARSAAAPVHASLTGQADMQAAKASEIQPSTGLHRPDQDFLSQHQVSNQAPDSSGAYAEPLMTGHHRHQSESMLDEADASTRDFASQHQVSNHASDSSGAYAEPLTTDHHRPQPESVPHEADTSTGEHASQHLASNDAPGEDGTYNDAPDLHQHQLGSRRHEASPSQAFTSQHHVRNSAPAEAGAYEQPLISDQQQRITELTVGSGSQQSGVGQQRHQPASEEHEADVSTHDFASRHHVSNARPDAERVYGQPLTHDQHEHQHEPQQREAMSSQGLTSEHHVRNSASAAQSAYAEPPMSDQQSHQPDSEQSLLHSALNFSSQHHVHNSAPDAEHTVAEPLTSTQHRRPTESGQDEADAEASVQDFDAERHASGGPPAPQEQHQGLAGRLMGTLFGHHGPQHDSAAEGASPVQAAGGGSQGQLQASTKGPEGSEAQQVVGSERQQASSDSTGAAEFGGHHHQQELAGQGPSEDAREELAPFHRQQQAPESQAPSEQSALPSSEAEADSLAAHYAPAAHEQGYGVPQSDVLAQDSPQCVTQNEDLSQNARQSEGEAVHAGQHQASRQLPLEASRESHRFSSGQQAAQSTGQAGPASGPMHASEGSHTDPPAQTVQQTSTEPARTSEQSAQEQHQSFTGRLMGTLFGHNPQHKPSLEGASQVLLAPEGSQRQLQGSTEGPEGQQVANYASSYQHEGAERRTRQNEPQEPVDIQQQQQASAGQTFGQQSLEQDADTAEAEADLATAQRAQRETVQAESESLQSSYDSLAELKQALQHGGGGESSEDQTLPSGVTRTHAERQQSSEMPEEDLVKQDRAQSVTQTAGLPRDAQRSQSQALHAEQQQASDELPADASHEDQSFTPGQQAAHSTEQAGGGHGRPSASGGSDTDVSAQHAQQTSMEPLHSSEAPAQQHESLAGRLMGTLFGRHTPEHNTAGEDAAEIQHASENSLRQPQISTAGLEEPEKPEEAEGQQVAHVERQQASTDSIGELIGVQHQERPSEDQAYSEQSVAQDSDVAEAESDLAKAQHAQREALQAESQSLQTSYDALAELKQALQHGEGGDSSEDRTSSSSVAQMNALHQQSSEVPQPEFREQGIAHSAAETDAVLRDAQHSQREAVQTGQQTSQGQQESLEDVRQAAKHHHGEESTSDAWQRVHQDQQADDGAAETEATLAAAQQAQQEALRVEQEALAEEHQTLQHLRESMQQQSGGRSAVGQRSAQHKQLQDDGLAEHDAALRGAHQLEREGLQAHLQSLHSKQEGLHEARQGSQGQLGATAEAGSEADFQAARDPLEAGTDDRSWAETNAALASAQQAGREAMLVGQTSLNDSHKWLSDTREAMQPHHQDDCGHESPSAGSQPDASQPPSAFTSYPHSAERDEPAFAENRHSGHAGYHHPGTGYQMGVEGATNFYMPQPSQSSYGSSEPSSYDRPYASSYPQHSSYTLPYPGQGSPEEGVVRQTSEEQEYSADAEHYNHPQAPSHTHPNQGRSHDTFHAGQSDPAQSSPRQGDHDILHEETVDPAHAGIRGDSDLHLPMPESASYARPEAGDALPEQAYSQQASRGDPNTASWVNQGLQGHSDWQQQPASLKHHVAQEQPRSLEYHEAEQQQPATQTGRGGFSGSYSIRRHTEHSSDSGTWFLTPRWLPVPEDQPVDPRNQHAAPHSAFGAYEQSQPQYQQSEPQYDHFEPSQPRHQQAATQYGHYEQAQPQLHYAESGHEDYSQDRAPTQYQQAQPQYDRSEITHPQYEYSEPYYIQHARNSPQYQQSQLWHEQHDYAPSPHHQQQPHYEHELSDDMDNQPEPRYAFQQHAPPQYDQHRQGQARSEYEQPQFAEPAEQHPAWYQHSAPDHQPNYSQHEHDGRAQSQHQPQVLQSDQPQHMQHHREEQQSQLGQHAQHGQGERAYSQHYQAESQDESRDDAYFDDQAELPYAGRFERPSQHAEQRPGQQHVLQHQPDDLPYGQYGQHEPAAPHHSEYGSVQSHSPSAEQQEEAFRQSPAWDADADAAPQCVNARSPQDLSEGHLAWEPQTVAQSEHHPHFNRAPSLGQQYEATSVEQPQLHPGQFHDQVREHADVDLQYERQQQQPVVSEQWQGDVQSDLSEQHEPSDMLHHQANSQPDQPEVAVSQPPSLEHTEDKSLYQHAAEQDTPLTQAASQPSSQALSVEGAQTLAHSSARPGGIAADSSIQVQQDTEIDGSTAETEAALAAAQQALQEALQVEQDALAEERQSLMHMRETMQQRSGPVVDDDDAVSEAGTEGESAATTEEALLRAQQTQGEAMLVGQNSLNDSRKRLLEVQHSLQRSHEEPHGDTSAEPAVPSRASNSPMAETELTDQEHPQSTGESVADALHPAGHADQGHQGSSQQSASLSAEARQPAPASTAESELFSRGGYSSAPPSSLWSRPAEVAALPPSSAQPLDRDSTRQLTSGNDRAAEAETAAVQEGSAGASAVTGDASESPRGEYAGAGWGNSRPATHANFARGNLSARPARVRPALPQHWVQAVDERAADSGTPTSARSLPDSTPTSNAATADPPSFAESTEASDRAPGPAGSLSKLRANSSKRLLPGQAESTPTSIESGRSALPEQADTAGLSRGTDVVDSSTCEPDAALWAVSYADASPNGLPRQDTSNAVRPNAAAATEHPSSPAVAATDELLHSAEHSTAAEQQADPGSTVTDRGQVSHAGQMAPRDAVRVQQEAASATQRWQYAGLGGTVAPVTTAAGNVSSAQPVPQSETLATPMPKADHPVTEGPEAEQPQASDAAVAQEARPVADAGAQAGHGRSDRAVHAVPLNTEAQQSSLPPAAEQHPAGAFSETEFHNLDPQSDQGQSSLASQDDLTRSSAYAAASGSSNAAPSWAIPTSSSEIEQTPEAATSAAAGAASAASAGAKQGQVSRTSTEHGAPKSAAMLSLEAMIPPPFEFGSPPDPPAFPAHFQKAKAALPAAPAQPVFHAATPPRVVDTISTSPLEATDMAPAEAGFGHAEATAEAVNDRSNEFRPREALAPPWAGDTRQQGLLGATSGARLTRLDSPEVQRRIEQSAVDVQQAVNERDGRSSPGVGLGVGGSTPADALARATGTLKALVAGHAEEAESLSRGLPTHSGTTETHPSERQAAAVRSVEGATQAAKAASLERGMQAAFVFATADRAAAMLKALAIGKPLDKMESVPEAALEGVPSADKLHEMGYGFQHDQAEPHHDQEHDEGSLVPEGSEGSFRSAVSQAAPAGSVASDMEYGSIVDGSAVDEDHDTFLNDQSDTGLLTRVDSFPHGRVDHYAPPLHPPPMSNLRSTPFDWGQPPAAAPSQASSVQAAEPDVYTAKRTLTVPVAETGADDRGRAVPSGPDPAAPREATVPSESGATFQNQGSGQRMRESSVHEADIENVNPQPVPGKQAAAAALHPTAPAAAASLPHQAFSETPPLSGAGQGSAAPAAAPEAAPEVAPGAASAAAVKPFMSSKALSQRLFGTEAAAAPLRPTSPFAELSTIDPVPGAEADVRAAAGKRPGAVMGTNLDERRSSGRQRADGTQRDSGNAERIEEALMSSVSPFSRRLSSQEVKPVLATLSQSGPSPIKEGEQRDSAVPQVAEGSPAATEGQQGGLEKAVQHTGSGPTAYKEVQPAKATPAVQHAPVPLQPSTAGNEPVPTRVVQEADDGKARFVCCGFGEKRAGSKARK